MEEVSTFAANHPLITIAVCATALVVVLYFIKKHFWRILLIALFTLVGYYLYNNGYFSKESLNRIKSVDVSKIEKSAEKTLDKGVKEIESFTANKIEKKADSARDEVKTEIMKELKAAPAKKANAAAAAPAAHKTKTPSAGGNNAVSH